MDITPILVALIATIAPITVAYAASVWAKIKYYRPLGMYDIDDIAARLVRAAEQVFTKDEREQKKAQVWQWMEDIAASHGMKLTSSEIDAAIEAAVYRMKNE
jgi:hypothetical protein